MSSKPVARESRRNTGVGASAKLDADTEGHTNGKTWQWG